jgi:hypothetical protein
VTTPSTDVGENVYNYGRGKEQHLKKAENMTRVDQALGTQTTIQEIELKNRLEAIDPDCMPGHRWALLEKIAHVNDIERCGYDYVVDRALEMTDAQLKWILGDVKGRRL